MVTKMKSLDLERKLNYFIRENPKYKASAERVRKLIEYEKNNPNKRKPYNFLEKFEDLIVYYKLHPKWEGKSFREIEKNKDAYSFYIAFCNRTKKLNKKVKRKLREKIIDYKHRDISSYKTIEDWKSEYNGHPGWKGKNLQRKNKKSEARSFYLSFYSWAKENSKGNNKRRELIQKIFKFCNKDWSSYNTLNDWKKEYNRHPGWKGMTTTDIQKNKGSDIKKFYRAFWYWAKEKERNKEKRRSLIRNIFKARQSDWSLYNTIEDWKSEYNGHPGWKGKNLQRKDKKWRAFYIGYSRWVKKKAKTKEKRIELIQKIFKSQRRWLSYNTIEDWKSEYNGHPGWKGMSLREIRKEEDGDKFYNAFIEWTKKTAKDYKEIYMFRKTIFSNNYKIISGKNFMNYIKKDEQSKRLLGLGLSGNNGTLGDVIESISKLNKDKISENASFEIPRVIREGRESLMPYIGPFVLRSATDVSNFLKYVHENIKDKEIVVSIKNLAYETLKNMYMRDFNFKPINTIKSLEKSLEQEKDYTMRSLLKKTYNYYNEIVNYKIPGIKTNWLERFPLS
jgi:hypothetical protein